MTTIPSQTSQRHVSVVMSSLLLLLTAFGPISMDLYLPVLPALTDELNAATSVAQLTVTACLIGLAVGQLVAGPLSDRFGRRTPLLVGITAYVVTSVLCAVSPSIEFLITVRLAQGLAGAVGIVIAQAAGRDLYQGTALVRYYARLTILGGLAAIVGPLIGGQLARFTDWRGLFVFLAVLGAALLLASLVFFRETLPPSLRTMDRSTRNGHDMRRLLRDRRFIGAVCVSGFSYAAIFAYLSGATYILQGIYGLSPQQYSLAFGLNSLGVAIAGFTAGRIAGRWSRAGTLLTGLLLALTGALGLLATGILQLGLPVVMTSLFIMVSGVSFAAPPTTALALEGYPDLAGTASSLLGLARYGFGGLVAPLVGVAGAGTVLPLGIVTVTGCLLAGACYLLCVREPSRHHA